MPRLDERPSFWETTAGSLLAWLVFLSCSALCVAILGGWDPFA